MPTLGQVNTSTIIDSLSGTSEQTSAITTDTSNSNSSPLSSFRGSLR